MTTNTNTTRPTFTPEQKEAWNKAKLLLKDLIAKGQTTRLRALHIAMSELRGTFRKHKGLIEQPSSKPDKRRQKESLDSQIRLRERIDEWKLYLTDPGAHKLYIIVKGGMSPSQKAVQASHAAHQFAKEHPHAPWINGTLVLLTPDPNYKDWRGKGITLEDFHPVDANGHWNSEGKYMTIWREPDMDNAITAVCILKEFQNSETGQHRGLKLL
jgi:hypothetical protein